MPGAAAVVIAALALSAAACGGSSRPSTARGQGTLLAFSRCLRAHGVPSFPDPQAGEVHAKVPSAQALGVADSVLGSAAGACRHLLPPGADDVFPASEARLLLIGMRSFSRCMRSHGVPRWPDPVVDAQGRPLFRLSAEGFTRRQAHAPQITHTIAECQRLLPTALGGVPLG